MTLNLLRRTLMVVDDLDPMRTVTLNQLRSLGCEKVIAMRSGVEALRRLRTQRVDAVVASWNMEGMSGLELLREVRADPKLSTLPFLMITAEAERHHVQEIIFAGVNALLVKPYSVGGLSARLEKMLHDADRAAALAAQRREQAQGNASLHHQLRDEMEAIARQSMQATLADVQAQMQALAQDDSLPPAQAEQIRHASLAAQQALDWVALTDELTRLDTGAQTLQLDPVDLGALLHARVEPLRTVYATKGLQLVVDTDTRIGTETPLAEVDERLCSTLVQLLLRIACDAAPRHSRVTVRLLDEDPLRVLIDHTAPLTDAQAQGFFSQTAGRAAARGAAPGAYVALRLAQSLGGDAVVRPAPIEQGAGDGPGHGASSAAPLLGTQLALTLPRHAFSPLPAAAAPNAP